MSPNASMLAWEAMSFVSKSHRAKLAVEVALPSSQSAAGGGIVG